MSDWRKRILDEFSPQTTRVTVALDPDGLLLEEQIMKVIHARGFELLVLEDNVSFRYVYESRFRSKWDRGENTDSSVVVHFKTREPNLIPFDLMHGTRLFSTSLVDVFPNLSYPIVAALELSDFDALSKAQEQLRPVRLGDNATKDFILRHVFGIAPESVGTSADLLRLLLRRHYRNQCLNAILDQRLIQVLRQNDKFSEWPLEEIVSDRYAFLSFLQERWPIFLDQLAISQSDSGEPGLRSYDLRYSGPVKLPFDDADIRIYIDNMFGEGLLHPVEPPESFNFAGTWVTAGIISDPKANRLKRLNRLLESVESSIPAIESKYRDWLRFAYLWGELNALWLDVEIGGQPQEVIARFLTLQATVDSSFLSWVENAYSGLHNQPAVPPVMVHHIPRALARQRESGELDKIALVVIDGLAIDQWIVIRNTLQTQLPDLRLNESACFAWLPTITSISRQAIFSGKAPIYFPSSISSTDRESASWTQFWMNNGLTSDEISYFKILEDNQIDELYEVAANPNVKVLGLVVTKVDRIMHGMELGAAGMHNLIRQWANEAFLAHIFDMLKASNFSLVLTSDHGNIEAKGLGCPSEGSIAELRGERVRIYPDSALRSRVKEQFPETIEWPSIGLPDSLVPLIAPARFAFITENHKTIAHGGISVEELIVPLVRIE
ncbi:MAG: BREX-3 system phosphatase PglZ [Dehalococcoidales bacterium]|nr:BREX-3 system phosphatase PglZ [Dehalococcoidales bacterium]